MPEITQAKNKDGTKLVKDRWYVRIFAGTDETGKRRTVSKTVRGTKRDAEKELRRMHAEKDKGSLVPHRCTVAHLLDGLLLDYKVNGKRLDWAEIVVKVHLMPNFGEMKADAVDTAILERYKAKRLEQGAANATVNHDLALLRRAFNLGAECDPPKVGRVPKFKLLTVNNARKGFFEYAEYKAIHQALPEEIRPLLTFGYFTGCRKGEILGLKWTQVDLVERVIRLEPGETKNKDGRTIAIDNPELFEVLTMQRDIRDRYHADCPWVFFRHATGERIITFKEAWKRACKKAGLWNVETGKPTRLFHDLRRSAVRDMIRSGTPDVVAMRVSGHKTRAVFDRYNIVNSDDLRQASRRLSEYRRSSILEPERPTLEKVSNGTDGGMIQ